MPKEAMSFSLPCLTFITLLYGPAPTGRKTEKHRTAMEGLRQQCMCGREGPLSRAVQLVSLRDATVLGASMSSRATAYRDGHNHSCQTAPHPLPCGHIFSSCLSLFVQCSDTSFLSATPCESSRACPLILCSPKLRLQQTST